MTDKKPKILFAFPVKHREVMDPAYLSTPNELFFEIPKGGIRPVMVTFGLFANYENPVSILVKIQRFGQPEQTDIPTSEGFYQNLRVHMLPDDRGVFLVSLEVSDVLFDEDGLYEIKTKLFKAEDPQRFDEAIDCHDSYFYVMTKKEQ